MMMLVDNIRSF